MIGRLCQLRRITHHLMPEKKVGFPGEDDDSPCAEPEASATAASKHIPTTGVANMFRTHQTLFTAALAAGVLSCCLSSCGEWGAEAPLVETVRVLVARKSLPYGASLKNVEELFEEKEILKADAPGNAVRKF